MAGRHLEGMRDYSSRVALVGGAAVINLTELGVDPAVLIDNTVYPIAAATRTDNNIALALRKVETENTIITDDELHGISYDKIAVTVDQHAEVLIEECLKLTNHSFAPQSHAAATPIVLTTGAERRTTGRKRLKVVDVIEMKRLFDNNKVPMTGRRLVLAPEHIGDILEEDEQFANQYKNIREGRVLRLHGFDIYEEYDMPLYTVGTNGDNTTATKNAYGAAPLATDRIASFAYYARNACKAMTVNKMYYDRADENPTMRENVIGFRKYFLSIPITARAFGSFVDDGI